MFDHDKAVAFGLLKFAAIVFVLAYLFATFAA